MKKHITNQKGIPQGIVIGLLSALIITMAGCAVISGLVLDGKIEQSQMSYGATVVIILASLFGALSAATAGERQMLRCLLFGSSYFVVLLFATILFFESAFENVWLTGLLILGNCAAAGFVGNRKKQSKYKIKKAGRYTA